MPIDVRIDEKLCKGQMTDAFTRAMTGDTVLVANDKMAADKMLSQSLLLTAPGSIRPVIKTVDAAITLITDPRAEKMKIHVAVNNCADALKVCLAANVTEVNMTRFSSKGENKEEFAPLVKVSEEDKVLLRQIQDKGIKVVYKAIPTVEGEDLAPKIG